MTNEIEEAEIINKYLCQIKKSLPLGIRLNKTELNDILDEIEEHIWEIAIENVGDKEPNEIDVQIAISQMGEPRDIASKFTSRSTPHVYISEELYPTYRKYRKSLFWASILFFLLYTLLFSLYFTIMSFSLIFIVHFIIIGMYFTSNVILGIIFCYLSLTGYIPYEIRKSKLLKRYSKVTQIQKPKFKSQFQIFIFWLEIIFFLINAMLIVFLSGLFINFIIISIIKILRGFTKTKSVKWQRSLILLDLFFMCIIILAVEKEIYSLFFAEIYTISDYLLFISIISILWVVFSLYIYYEVHVFITLKEKQELYLKELSLIKRINKKEIILGALKNHDSPNTQNIPSNNQPLSIKSSKINSEYEDVIKTYLKKARRKLPIWLKKAEKQEIIKNLEEEIREAVSDYEEKVVLTKENLENFLANLESIKTILSEYKERGSPKIFISKELWPWYLATLKSFLAYFIIMVVFTIVLQISSNIILIFFNYFPYFYEFWYYWILILLLVTQLFTILSLHDFIPEKREILETKKNKSQKFNRYIILEILFGGFYIIMGASSIILVLLGNYSINLLGYTMDLLSTDLIFTISGLLLLLGVIKISKIVFKRKKIILKSVLIILSLILSLVINFIIVYDFHSIFPIGFDKIILIPFPILTLYYPIFLPINIEIIYEIFHLFFKKKSYLNSEEYR